jgi:hypothetical protein
MLALAPAPILAITLGISRWARCEPQERPSDNQATVRGQDPESSTRKPPITSRFVASPALERECQVRADNLRDQLDPGATILVRPPFVLSGDLSAEAFERWYSQTVGPAARTMGRIYFRNPPTRPITILLFGEESSYNRSTKRLFGEEGISVYGYYKPQQRTLVMNIGTGGGTLVHELTHALIDFDFPQVPDWFNEGLASLHEACHISPDETGIEGLPNWRLPGLQRAVTEKRLPSLERMIGQRDFRGEQVGLNYAQARYFCLYLQHEHLLESFYREFRDAHSSDPTGAATIRKVFGQQKWADLDADFQRWVMTLKWQRS